LNKLQIELKALSPNAVIPKYMTPGAAAMDLYAPEPCVLMRGELTSIPLGIAIHIKDPDICGIIAPRSGLACKYDVMLANSVGIIDSDYTGELVVVLKIGYVRLGPYVINQGDRIAQIMFVPILRPKFDIVGQFSETTSRGNGGFGSTGTT